MDDGEEHEAVVGVSPLSATAAGTATRHCVECVEVVDCLCQQEYRTYSGVYNVPGRMSVNEC